MNRRRRILALLLLHIPLVFAGSLSPYQPGQQHRQASFMPPGGHLSSGAPRFVLGTDRYGRDQLSRLLHGGRFSIGVGTIGALGAVLIATIVGALAGYAGGWIDAVAMRVTEIAASLPWLYLLLAIRAFLPLRVEPRQAYAIMVAVLVFVG